MRRVLRSIPSSWAAWLWFQDVASFLGFKWRHADINALDAIAYYLKYQTYPEAYREKIQAVIDYNEDDCRATKRIKDWLQEQCASTV